MGRGPLLTRFCGRRLRAARSCRASMRCAWVRAAGLLLEGAAASAARRRGADTYFCFAKAEDARLAHMLSRVNDTDKRVKEIHPLIRACVLLLLRRVGGYLWCAFFVVMLA